MSQEEEDQLIGRAMREKAQVDKRLALIAHELERLAKELANLQNDLRIRAMGPTVASSPLSVSTEVSRYLECSKLVALVDEQNELSVQRASLIRVISGSGQA